MLFLLYSTFVKVVLNIDRVSLWKSDGAVKKVSVWKKLPVLFVRKRSMQLGLLGFL